MLFKVIIKVQYTIKRGFKKALLPVCSTLSSWIRGFVFWWHEQVNKQLTAHFFDWHSSFGWDEKWPNQGYGLFSNLFSFLRLHYDSVKKNDWLYCIVWAESSKFTHKIKYFYKKKNPLTCVFISCYIYTSWIFMKFILKGN